MELAPADVPLTFEVTFDQSDLAVAMSVYDNSGSSPVLLLSPFAMVNVVANTYAGKCSLAPGNYVILKAVYTDGTFTTLSDNYSQGSESVVTQYLNNSNGGCELIGIVENNDELIGLVEC